MTPLSNADCVADIAPRLPDYQPLLVAGLRLGVLSHAFGAMEALQARGARKPLVILSDRFRESPAWFVESTRDDLASRGLRAVAFVGHGAPPESVDFSALLDASC